MTQLEMFNENSYRTLYLLNGCHEALSVICPGLIQMNDVQQKQNSGRQKKHTHTHMHTQQQRWCLSVLKVMHA